MRCYLVRHAQTLWNGENRLQGHSDLELNAVGRQQAERVGSFLKTCRSVSEPIRALYTSHLKRSLQTAQAIAHHVGLAPTVEPALSEIGLGTWEGLTPEEIDARFDGAYQRWRRCPSEVTIPGGEPIDRFRRRVHEAFHRMTSRADEGGATVIVSHGGVIATWLAEWLGVDYDQVLRRVMLDNGSVSAVECRAHPPHILWVNAIQHLTPDVLTPSWDLVAPSA